MVFRDENSFDFAKIYNLKVMNEFLDLNSLMTSKTISGWGRRGFVNSKLLNLGSSQEIINLIKGSQTSSLITRGLGRSYGDAAQLKDDFVLNISFSNGISLSGNQLTVGGGVSISKLLEVIVPLGYFLPVSPGSAQVTIGGAVAADVHGKNHHKDGSLGNHVSRILLIDGKGEIQEIKPKLEHSEENNNFFWATIGGMGLTGIILEVTISLIKIETSLMKVDTFICNELEILMDLMRSKDQEYSYSVAWVDSLHKKTRGVLTCGEHAKLEDLDNTSLDLLSYDSKNLGTAPRFLPNGILNKLTVKAFNEFWFRKSGAIENSIQTISQFFHPLDGVSNWNRIYGSQGFYQYQFVIPDDKTYFVPKTLDRLKKCSSYSFLTVLKRFGKRNNAFLSFPQPGWTLAVDLPGSNVNLLDVLEELDNELASIGGKIYLAKDSRQTSEMFKKTYRSYKKWKNTKNEMDPDNLFQSDLSKRLRM